MKKIFRNILLFILFVIPGCSVSSRNFTEQDPLISRREILNYEFQNKYYAKELKAQHFTLNIEIDMPAVIEIDEIETDDIYTAASVNGETIVRFTVDRTGRVKKWKIKKRAGLGLDNYAKAIIKKIKIRPMYHRGEPGASEFNARFVFRERQ